MKVRSGIISKAVLIAKRRRAINKKLQNFLRGWVITEEPSEPLEISEGILESVDEKKKSECPSEGAEPPVDLTSHTYAPLITKKFTSQTLQAQRLKLEQEEVRKLGLLGDDLWADDQWSTFVNTVDRRTSDLMEIQKIHALGSQIWSNKSWLDVSKAQTSNPAPDHEAVQETHVSGESQPHESPRDTYAADNSQPQETNVSGMSQPHESPRDTYAADNSQPQETNVSGMSQPHESPRDTHGDAHSQLKETHVSGESQPQESPRDTYAAENPQSQGTHGDAHSQLKETHVSGASQPQESPRDSDAMTASITIGAQIGQGRPSTSTDEVLAIATPSFRILDEMRMRNDKFKIDHHVVRIQLEDEDNGGHLLGIPAALSSIMEQERLHAGVHDFLGFSISSSYAGKDIEVEFRRQSEISLEHALDQISSVIQSNQQFLAGRSIEVEVTRIEDLRGRGPPEAENHRVARNTKKDGLPDGIIFIENVNSPHFTPEDIANVNYTDLCFLSAVNMGIEQKKFEASGKTKDDQSAWRSAQRQDSKKFVKGVQALYEKCNLDFSNGCNSEKISCVEQVLGAYRIVVYDGNTNAGLRYKGYQGPEKRTTLFLYYNNKSAHFHYIPRIGVFLSRRMFCEICQTAVNNKIHKCGIRERCRKCSTFCKTKEQKDTSKKVCPECNVTFYSLTCYSNHKENRLCENRNVCLTCGSMYRKIGKNFKHICDTVFCRNCRVYCKQPHYCFLKARPRGKNFEAQDVGALVSFADFESRQETYLGEGVYQHVINLAHIQTVCTYCRDKEFQLPDFCANCGPRNATFDDLDGDRDVIGDFLNYCSSKAARRVLADQVVKPAKLHVILFHYGQGYDSIFLLKYVLDHPHWLVETIIFRGRKIMKMELRHVKTGVLLRILDMYNFVPKALSALPAAFHLEENLQKLDFPHLFNRKSSYDYNECRLPDIKYWNVDNMPEKQRSRVLEWHAMENNRRIVEQDAYNFKQQLRYYCELDCTILRKAGCAFRREFIKMGLDPYLEAMTLASVSSLLFRRLYYTPDSIGIIPEHGYRSRQSKEGLMWLVWREMVEGHEIHHAGNNKEKRIQKTLVDGYYKSADGTETIYEYMGCYFHSCPQCYPASALIDLDHRGDDAKNRMTLLERRAATENRLELLRSKGYTLRIMYGCEFKKILKNNKNLHARLLKHPLVQSYEINPRDALKGGRTNAIRLYAQACSKYRIRYMDFTSLYPFTMKYLEFPKSHPKVYQGDKCPPVTEIFGLILCKLLPPDNLNMPVIPTTINGKLMFVLCPKCAMTLSKSECTHTDEERSITGTFTSMEVQLALRMNYRLVCIYECWHYESTRELWAKYINTMLKGKQMASGWPRPDMTEEEKIKYIADYLKKEGIQLEYDQIEKNECLRQLFKLLLNSLWGKFGQNPLMQKSLIVENPDELMRVLAAPNITVKSVIDTLGSKVLVNYVDTEGSDHETFSTNVVLAAMTTGHARVMLYQILDIVGDSICYMDTDSALFLEPRDKPILKTSPYLGGLVDEIEAAYPPGAEISAYVSIGPKSYCLEVAIPNQEPVTIRKLKGVTLKHSNKDVTDFATMKNLVDGNLDAVSVKIVNQIERAADFRIFTRSNTSKKVQLVYTKRARLDSDPYLTKPWGMRSKAKPVVPDTRYEIADWNVRSYKYDANDADDDVI